MSTAVILTYNRVHSLFEIIRNLGKVRSLMKVSQTATGEMFLILVNEDYVVFCSCVCACRFWLSGTMLIKLPPMVRERLFCRNEIFKKFSLSLSLFPFPPPLPHSHPPVKLWPRVKKPIQIIRSKSNKLSNRFYPYPEITVRHSSACFY